MLALLGLVVKMVNNNIQQTKSYQVVKTHMGLLRFYPPFAQPFPGNYLLYLNGTLTSKIVFLTFLKICKFFSNVASISRRLLTISGPFTPWKQGSGVFVPSYILAKCIWPSQTYTRANDNIDHKSIYFH